MISLTREFCAGMIHLRSVKAGGAVWVRPVDVKAIEFYDDSAPGCFVRFGSGKYSGYPIRESVGEVLALIGAAKNKENGK